MLIYVCLCLCVCNVCKFMREDLFKSCCVSIDTQFHRCVCERERERECVRVYKMYK